MKQAKRKRLFVDREVQGRLLCRVVVYWFAALMVVGGLALAQVAFESRQAPFPVVLNRAILAFGPALIAGVVVLPLILFDATRFSNKFAGPMHRLRREVKRLADGKPCDPITFRQGDFWYDLAEDFNRLADRLEKLEETGAFTEPNSNEREERLSPITSS